MILKERYVFMHRFSVLFSPIFLSIVTLSAAPAAGDAPVIATEKFVRSGLATRVSNTAFDSFRVSLESFQNRDAGFATAAQGAKADTALQPVALVNYLAKSGGTMTGAIAMDGAKIMGLGVPTAATDAATKAYVDTTARMSGAADAWWAPYKNNTALPGIISATDTPSDGRMGGLWSVIFANGEFRGISWCSDRREIFSPNSGPNCWCRITQPVINGSYWVFYNTSDSDGCFWLCADACAYCVSNGSGYDCTRSAMLAPIEGAIP
ncbi:MAG: hypothetical protein LBB08_01090 [Rickettsiales bacterium]|nr:hypothetical protein [Rickettsiales bacterium]